MPDSSEQTAFADASVIINILSTGHAIEILSALGVRIQVESTALSEVRNDVPGSISTEQMLEHLVRAGLLVEHRMCDRAQEIFFSLVGQELAESSDDGEAATLAMSVVNGCDVVLDERKARRIAAKRWPKLKIASTAELLAQDRVAAALGNDLHDAVHRALKIGNMQVLPAYLPWISGLLGRELLVSCVSLPRWFREQL